MSEPRTILVTGATGKQGRSVIDALQALPPSSSPFHIVAMVRDPTSSSAQALLKLPNVSLVKGDLADPAAAFSAYGKPIWGVYSVQVESDDEIAQGKAVVDAATAHGVRHLVYSSGDRGGLEKSNRDPTKVRNFAAKYAIEKHLEAAALASSSLSQNGGGSGDGDVKGLTYTILRPVTFFENQTRDIHGKGFARLWMQMKDGHKPLQLISTRDIGWFAAAAFADPDAPHHRNAALSIAGDELSGRQAEAVFRDVTGGRDLPMVPCLVGKALKVSMRQSVGDMFDWFEAEGYGADIDWCRRTKPGGMIDYGTWLKEYSGFV